MRSRTVLVIGLGACVSTYSGPRLAVDVDPAEVTPCAFEPIGGTRMSRYACNPVEEPETPWSTGTLGMGVRVDLVLGHPVYQMWIAGQIDDREGGPYAMGMATSDDGVTWVPYVRNPRYTSPLEGWDAAGMRDIQVAWHPTLRQYVLLYRGLGSESDGVGILSSFDGLSWFPHPSSPLLRLGEGGPVSWCGPLALTWRENRGLSGLVAGADSGGPCSVYALTGLGPDDLRPGAEPLLGAGPQAYDVGGISSAAQVPMGDGFGMFYVGADREGRRSLNLATSTDGVTWIKLGSNPIPVESQADSEITRVQAHAVGDRIHLWIEETKDSVSRVGYFLHEPGILTHP